MNLLNGTYYCKLDNKGRIMLPAELRRQLTDLNHEGFVLKRAIFKNYLELYPQAEWDKIMHKLNKLNRFKKKHVEFLTRFLAGVRYVSINTTGRMQIPKDLLNLANLKKEVVIASEINLLQIWDKDTYEEFLRTSADHFSDLAEDIGNEFDGDWNNE